jgi:hypothetical protein
MDVVLRQCLKLGGSVAIGFVSNPAQQSLSRSAKGSVPLKFFFLELRFFAAGSIAADRP